MSDNESQMPTDFSLDDFVPPKVMRRNAMPYPPKDLSEIPMPQFEMVGLTSTSGRRTSKRSSSEPGEQGSTSGQDTSKRQGMLTTPEPKKPKVQAKLAVVKSKLSDRRPLPPSGPLPKIVMPLGVRFGTDQYGPNEPTQDTEEPQPQLAQQPKDPREPGNSGQEGKGQEQAVQYGPVRSNFIKVDAPFAFQSLGLATIAMCPRCIYKTRKGSAIVFPDGNCLLSHYICAKCVQKNQDLMSVMSR